MGRKVLQLKAHSTLFIPSLGNLSDTLPPSLKTLEGLEMEMGAEGVYVKVPSKKVEAVIPYGNISCLVLAPQEIKK